MTSTTTTALTVTVAQGIVGQGYPNGRALQLKVTFLQPPEIPQKHS